MYAFKEKKHLFSRRRSRRRHRKTIFARCGRANIYYFFVHISRFRFTNFREPMTPPRPRSKCCPYWTGPNAFVCVCAWRRRDPNAELPPTENRLTFFPTTPATPKPQKTFAFPMKRSRRPRECTHVKTTTFKRTWSICNG